MKKTLFTVGLILGLVTSSFGQQPPQSDRKIQVAILFDTSNSMDGLIDQAKSRIWNIVNEVASLTHNGLAPTIEIAIYEYGNDGLEASDNYIRQVLDLSTDLDLISEKLFALTTNGGSEFCGAVIDKSLDDLNWSPVESDLKMIYIAGNEPFTQGPVSYKEVCTEATGKGIFINTIYCGNYNKGVTDSWKAGADCSNGDYFNIDSDKEIVHIETPYDVEIRSYNDSINTTYYGYGSIGKTKKSAQLEQDANAVNQSTAVMTERAITKSKKSAYKNEAWDLVDAEEAGMDITEISEEELPDEFKGLSPEEKEAKLKEIKEQREVYQEKIDKLAKDRQLYIDEEMKKRSENSEVDDFGSSVNESIIKKANAIGFKKEPVEN